jgi:hypothetical protein
MQPVGATAQDQLSLLCVVENIIDYMFTIIYPVPLIYRIEHFRTSYDKGKHIYNHISRPLKVSSNVAMEFACSIE